jgi:hypothetical protein
MTSQIIIAGAGMAKIDTEFEDKNTLMSVFFFFFESKPTLHSMP